MKILIVYATNSGATHEIAYIIRDDMVTARQTVTIISAQDAQPETLQAYDVILFGSGSWDLRTPTKVLEGQMEYNFIKFSERLHGHEFPNKKFAVFGCGDSGYSSYCGATNHLEVLVNQLKGTKVGTTLKIDRFFFDIKHNTTRIRSWTRRLLKAII